MNRNLNNKGQECKIRYVKGRRRVGYFLHMYDYETLKSVRHFKKGEGKEGQYMEVLQ
jgi:hypothetical protein